MAVPSNPASAWEEEVLVDWIVRCWASSPTVTSSFDDFDAWCRGTSGAPSAAQVRKHLGGWTRAKKLAFVESLRRQGYPT